MSATKGGADRTRPHGRPPERNRPDPSSGGVVNRLETAVGAEVRATRQALGVTLADLARAAEISTGMLSKIENGQTSPSLATLEAIAAALNVPIATFFATFDQKREATYVRPGEGLAIERRGSAKGHVYRLLGHSLRSPTKVEPFLITLDETSDAYPIFQHAGIEFIYMLEGEITYRHGRETYLLEPGASLFFDAAAPHGPLELRRLPAVFLSVIVTPGPSR